MKLIEQGIDTKILLDHANAYQVYKQLPPTEKQNIFAAFAAVTNVPYAETDFSQQAYFAAVASASHAKAKVHFDWLQIAPVSMQIDSFKKREAESEGDLARKKIIQHKQIEFTKIEQMIRNIYEGNDPNCGISADRIAEKLRRVCGNHAGTPEHPTIALLQFLIICVGNVELHQLCTHCPTKPLLYEHRIYDHLKQLLFLWIELKLQKLPEQDDEHLKIQKSQAFFNQLPSSEQSFYQPILFSILATLYPLIKNSKGFPAYDILGVDNHIYKSFHLRKSMPYVRLGAIMKESYRYFTLDCRNFDMRGVDLSGLKFFSQEYIQRCRRNALKIKPEELLNVHANFCNTDLRGANLSKTDFRLRSAIENMIIDASTKLQDSNLEAVRTDVVSHVLLK